jgi:hypothetical protein
MWISYHSDSAGITAEKPSRGTMANQAASTPCIATGPWAPHGDAPSQSPVPNTGENSTDKI